MKIGTCVLSGHGIIESPQYMQEHQKHWIYSICPCTSVKTSYLEPVSVLNVEHMKSLPAGIERVWIRHWCCTVSLWGSTGASTCRRGQENHMQYIMTSDSIPSVCSHTRGRSRLSFVYVSFNCHATVSIKWPYIAVKSSTIVRKILTDTNKTQKIWKRLKLNWKARIWLSAKEDTQHKA